MIGPTDSLSENLTTLIEKVLNDCDRNDILLRLILVNKGNDKNLYYIF